MLTQLDFRMLTNMLPHAMTRALLGFALLGLAVTAYSQELRTGSPESVGMSSERLERLSDTLQAYVDRGQLAGSVTLVARRGRIAYFEAFGRRDREANAPMRPDTIFRIASQSKAIVSVAAMTAVDTSLAPRAEAVIRSRPISW